MEPIRITRFSDTLCVWAYVSQVRMDELQKNFPGSVAVDTRYFHVFGNVADKIDAAWKDRGGLRGYREHVRSVVDKFAHVTLHAQAWERSAPHSSMPSHLFLCAVRLLDSSEGAPGGLLARAEWAVREAFFKRAPTSRSGTFCSASPSRLAFRARRSRGSWAPGPRTLRCARISTLHASTHPGQSHAAVQRRTAAAHRKRGLPDHRGQCARTARGCARPAVLVLRTCARWARVILLEHPGSARRIICVRPSARRSAR